MGDIKVSVIIPVYNMEKYIEECLESVFAQTLQEIEVICIDDGSTDRSQEILNEYARKYLNLKLIRQCNKGSGAARNRGISLASGKYLAFMDPDDLYPSEMVLQVLYEKAIEQNALICGGSACTYRSEDGSSQQRILADKTFREEGWVNFREYQYPYGYWRFLYSRQLLLEHKIEFPLYRRYQDPMFMVKSFLVAEKFYVVPTLVYSYRKEFFDIDFKKESKFEGFLGRKEVLDFAVKYNLPQLWKTVYSGFTGKRISLLYRWYIQEPMETKRLFTEICRTGVMMGFVAYDESINMFDIVEHEARMVANVVAYAEEFYETVRGYADVIVYGAGLVGEEIVAFLRKHVEGTDIMVAVSSMNGNMHKLDGIPIYEIRNLLEMREKALVVIATEEKKRAEIRRQLEAHCFSHIIEADYTSLEMYDIVKMLQGRQKSE